MDWMLLVLFFVGLVTGNVITFSILLKRKTAGDLVVLDEEGEDPYIFLKINKEDIEALRDNNVIELLVDRKDWSKRRKNQSYYETGDFVTERRINYGRKA